MKVASHSAITSRVSRRLISEAIIASRPFLFRHQLLSWVGTPVGKGALYRRLHLAVTARSPRKYNQLAMTSIEGAEDDAAMCDAAVTAMKLVRCKGGGAERAF